MSMSKERFDRLAEGLLFMSETDAPLTYYELDSERSRQWPPSTAGQFLQLIGENPAPHNAQRRNLNGSAGAPWQDSPSLPRRPKVLIGSIGAESVSLQGVTPQNLRGVSGRAYIPKLGVFRNIAHIRAPYYYSTSFALAAEC